MIPIVKLNLKTFHCEIVNDHETLKKETDNYKDIPVIRKIDNAMVQRNYLQIKQDIKEIIENEMERIIKNPALASLILKKED